MRPGTPTIPLTSQTSAASNRVFAYDATGNRTRVEQTSAPASTLAFTIAPSSNRVGQRAGVAVTYDAAGHQTGDPETNATYTYDQGGRLRTASIGGVLKSTRTYNGLGQRVIKDTTPHDNRVIRAVYDEAGHVLGEAVLQGGRLLHYREYVWLEDRPLAQFTNVRAGSTWTSSVIDYLHTNQLERPLFMTDSAGVEVYRWQPTDAFGVGTHNTDVDGNGQQRDLRLGLPGQQWDAETATWYNYFRDYNARWGRYTQSDPIGLAGGINTYGYVAGNPQSGIDPLGLAACGSDKDCIERCLREYYGDWYEQAKDLAPLRPIGWAWDEFSEWAEDKGRKDATRDLNEGRHRQGKRIMRAAKALGAASAASSVVGFAAGAFALGAYSTCYFRCEIDEK